ncbi:MAG: RHS repeat-associated core domain-containing protein [Steroidobacteraceae bacterium]|jgi:RHS repeat-associated protein|nr:RHS repeat-associated core domain-containing protein [Steroidobacteraceae bacterium]
MRDHLGSPELVTNATGAQVVKLSFGAFGERRGATWTGTPSSGDWTAIGNTTRDGFTDHEHLDAVGLIHMNGRVYDPKVARFLSADPFIDRGLGTQGVNRYGYVGNNPLNRIDPSGFTACDPFGHGPIRVDGHDMPRFAEIVVRGAQFPPPPPGAFVTFGPMLDSSGRVFEMGAPGGGDYERQEVSELGEVTVTATRTGQKRHRPPPVVVFGGGPGGVVAAGAADAGGPDPMQNNAGREADRQQCFRTCTGIGSVVADLSGSTAAGFVAGLQVSGGNPFVGGIGALAGITAGMAGLGTASSTGGNWAQVSIAATAGGLAGGATMIAAGSGVTGFSGGVAGGLLSGVFSTAGMPAPIAASLGNGIGSLGMPGNAWPQIGRNVLTGMRHGFVAGFVGVGISLGGRALTAFVCDQVCSE